MSDERRLKVLFLAANPVNQARPLRSGREFEALRERLAATDLPVRVDLVSSWGANPEDLQRVLLKERPAVVHFSGHAEGDIGILLEGKADGNTVSLGAKILTDVFRAVNALLGSERIRCLVLNACESEGLARAVCDDVKGRGAGGRSSRSCRPSPLSGGRPEEPLEGVAGLAGDAGHLPQPRADPAALGGDPQTATTILLGKLSLPPYSSAPLRFIVRMRASMSPV